MGFSMIGLGAKLTFDAGGAVLGMGKAETACKSMTSRFDTAGAGLSKMASGLKTLAMAGAVVTVGFGYMVGQAANFEQSMANLKAAVQPTKEEFLAMKQMAMDLGAKTTFSSTQAADAMTELAKSGMATADVLETIPAVLAMAAAEGMDLAQASKIVTDVMSIMGLKASQSAHASDVLAAASVATKTSIAGLGESFVYGGAAAKKFGYTLEETVGILSIMSSSGLEGSMAGSSFAAMLRELAAPSSKQTKALKELGVSLVTVGADGKKTFKKMPQLVNEFSASIDAIQDPIKRAAVSNILFGVNGEKAFMALKQQGGAALEALTTQLELADGAASKMAAIRVDTFKGQLDNLKSSVEILAITLSGTFMEPMTKGFANVAIMVGKVAMGLEMLLNPIDRTTKAGQEQQKKWDGLGKTAQSVAQGMLAGIGVLQSWASRAKTFLSGIAETLKKRFGEDMVSKIAKVGTIILGIAVVAAPVLGLLIGGFMLLGAVISIVSGAFTFLWAAAGILWSVKTYVVLLVAAFQTLQQEGETPLQTIMRLLSGLWEFAKGFFTSFYNGIKTAFAPLKTEVVPLWENLKLVLKSVFGAFGMFFKGTKSSGSSWGSRLAAVVNYGIIWPMRIAVTVLGFVATMFTSLGVAIGWLASIVARAAVAIYQSFISFLLAPVYLVIAAWNLASSVASTVWGAISGYVMPVYNLLKDIATVVGETLVDAWNTVSTTVTSVISTISKPIKDMLDWVNQIIEKIKAIPGLKAALGTKGAGDFGPLPVSPGPTPAKLSAPPVATPSTNIQGGGSGDITIHTHLILDGREVAISVERFKAERKMRATKMSPGALREYIETTSGA